MTHREDSERADASMDDLAAVIDWELKARLAVGDDPATDAGRKKLAHLIADSVLDHFVVRRRSTPPFPPE